MANEPTLRPLVPDDVPACEQILAALPDWFGIPDVNRDYIEGLTRLPAAVVVLQGAVVGFDPLFESTTLWGPEDAALILVRRIASAHAD